jgi:hypothetical protein
MPSFGKLEITVMFQDDHFSAQADYYAQYRPRYPAELFAYLAGIAPGHELAWDAGTGNGQAALGLAAHFAWFVGPCTCASDIFEKVAQIESRDHAWIKAQDIPPGEGTAGTRLG